MRYGEAGRHRGLGALNSNSSFAANIWASYRDVMKLHQDKRCEMLYKVEMLHGNPRTESLQCPKHSNPSE